MILTSISKNCFIALNSDLLIVIIIEYIKGSLLQYLYQLKYKRLKLGGGQAYDRSSD
jgi:hypothetical protein